MWYRLLYDLFICFSIPVHKLIHNDIINKKNKENISGIQHLVVDFQLELNIIRVGFSSLDS